MLTSTWHNCVRYACVRACFCVCFFLFLRVKGPENPERSNVERAGTGISSVSRLFGLCAGRRSGDVHCVTVWNDNFSAYTLGAYVMHCEGKKHNNINPKPTRVPYHPASCERAVSVCMLRWINMQANAQQRMFESLVETKREKKQHTHTNQSSVHKTLYNVSNLSVCQRAQQLQCTRVPTRSNLPSTYSDVHVMYIYMTPTRIYSGTCDLEVISIFESMFCTKYSVNL